MEAAEEFFAALEARDRHPGRFERSVAAIRHLLERGARTVAQRRPGLIESARIDLEDVVQELTHKILRDPPSARGRSEAVIVGWAKVVARNHLIDLAAKNKAEDPIDERAAARPSRQPDPDRAFDARAAASQLERCAGELNDRYRAAYDLLREDSEMPRLEIASRLGLVDSDDVRAATTERVDPSSALGDRLRKAQANAWAIVSRVRTKLAECLDRHGLLGLLPDTLSKLRQRREKR
jgi:RNA polymerase sigma factor (sigma-70 family)